METIFSALALQNYPKLPEYQQLTGTKSTQLSQRPYNFPQDTMFGMSGLLDEGDFTDHSSYCVTMSISLQREQPGLR